MGETIAMFELHFDGNDVSIIREQHYKLTEAGNISDKERPMGLRGRT
jgi:hypothetical protein